MPILTFMSSHCFYCPDGLFCAFLLHKSGVRVHQCTGKQLKSLCSATACLPLPFKTHLHKKCIETHNVSTEICRHWNTYLHTPVLGLLVVVFRCQDMSGYAFSLQPLKGFNFPLITLHLWPFPYLERATPWNYLYLTEPIVSNYTAHYSILWAGMCNWLETKARLWELWQETVLNVQSFGLHKHRQGHW